jgi:hypothetical protein
MLIRFFYSSIAHALKSPPARFCRDRGGDRAGAVGNGDTVGTFGNCNRAVGDVVAACANGGAGDGATTVDLGDGTIDNGDPDGDNVAIGSLVILSSILSNIASVFTGLNISNNCFELYCFEHIANIEHIVLN